MFFVDDMLWMQNMSLQLQGNQFTLGLPFISSDCRSLAIKSSQSKGRVIIFHLSEKQISRDEKTDLPNVKGEVKQAIKATFAHLCTTLTRDKCLPLLAVKGESSGDKGRFCHAFNPYL